MSEKSTGGFTLLEVLVALVILSLVVAFFASTVSDSLGRAERVDTESRATVLADTLLVRLGRDIPINIGATTGRDGSLAWRIVIVPYSSVGSGLTLDEIDLTVAGQFGRVIGHWQTLRLATEAPPP